MNTRQNDIAKRNERVACVLFDLDGTLTDSGEGVMGSAAYAFRKLGLPVPEPRELRTMVGPPLSSSFPRLGVPQDKVEEAIAYYRDDYNDGGGKLRNSVFPGVEEMLRDLKERGLRLFVATSKPEGIAREVLTTFGLTGYLEYIAGASSDRSRETKADVLRHLLEETGYPEGLVMVGDTIWDVLGAKELGIPCVGVSWGYAAPGELEAAGADAIAKDMEELLHMLCT